MTQTRQKKTLTVDRAEESSADNRAARRLAAEDIRTGQYVALMQVAYEYPTFSWCMMDTLSFPIEKPIRITYLPFRDCQPMKVESVCLPFVFCKTACNLYEVIDVRQNQLAELDRSFGKFVFAAWNSKDKSSKNAKKKKKRRKRNKDRKKD